MWKVPFDVFDQRKVPAKKVMEDVYIYTGHGHIS